MSAIYILVLVSIIVAIIFLGAFIWSVKDNQLEDQKGASFRILFDNETQSNSLNKK